MNGPSRSGRVIIAGGSGFLGVSLATHLAARGTSIVLLSRHPPKIGGPWEHVTWDGRTLGEWHRELDGAIGVVNLTGRSVDCVKTPDHRDELLRSRVEATRVLGQALRVVESPPPVWVQMSTAHIYGDPPEVTCTEESPFGCGLAPFVGRAWEEEFRASVLDSQRPVILRTSFVLGLDRGAGGGALARLLLLARLGLGGAQPCPGATLPETRRSLPNVPGPSPSARRRRRRRRVRRRGNLAAGPVVATESSGPAAPVAPGRGGVVVLPPDRQRHQSSRADAGGESDLRTGDRELEPGKTREQPFQRDGRLDAWRGATAGLRRTAW